MITLADLTTLLGWASIINIGFFTFAALMLVFMRGTISSLHSKMFGIPENELALFYFRYLANFKTLLFVFSLAPYFALKLMGQ
tara:strand:- start:3111 stop:3359 length:249 start_codon:yes stop_codon:yes gene_type:complete